jgi:hypothetical protein
MRGPSVFDGDHVQTPTLRIGAALPAVLMLAEVEPVWLGPRYHTIVCVRTRRPERIYPASLACLEFGVEHSLAAFGVASLES